MKKFCLLAGILFLMLAGCSSEKKIASSAPKDCSALKPVDPYQEHSGHRAGFEWGQSGKACEGNSRSFVEGCEAWEDQEKAYRACAGDAGLR